MAHATPATRDARCKCSPLGTRAARARSITKVQKNVSPEALAYILHTWRDRRKFPTEGYTYTPHTCVAHVLRTGERIKTEEITPYYQISYASALACAIFFSRAMIFIQHTIACARWWWWCTIVACIYVTTFAARYLVKRRTRAAFITRAAASLFTRRALQLLPAYTERNHVGNFTNFSRKDYNFLW